MTPPQPPTKTLVGNKTIYLNRRYHGWFGDFFLALDLQIRYDFFCLAIKEVTRHEFLHASLKGVAPNCTCLFPGDFDFLFVQTNLSELIIPSKNE